MNIPWWGIGGSIALIIYLIATDFYLHRRVKRLEAIVRRLEGVSDNDREQQQREKAYDKLGNPLG